MVFYRIDDSPRIGQDSGKLCAEPNVREQIRGRRSEANAIWDMVHVNPYVAFDGLFRGEKLDEQTASNRQHDLVPHHLRANFRS